MYENCAVQGSVGTLIVCVDWKLCVLSGMRDSQ